jgi:hypothetical protein
MIGQIPFDPSLNLEGWAQLFSFHSWMEQPDRGLVDMGLTAIFDALDYPSLGRVRKN